MTQGEERVIKPPVEQIVSGRVFHPDNAFLYKKWLRVFIVLVFLWVLLWFVFFSHSVILSIILVFFDLTELIVNAGWLLVSQIYWALSGGFFICWILYTYVYVKRIDYSLASWEGDVSPEIYVKKGIIQITQRHVPFRTITHVKTTRGVFDRLFGLGTIQIETAAKKTTSEGGGLIALLLQRAMRGGSAEENIEGVKFHEELRDFILRELRKFGMTSRSSEAVTLRRERKKIFNHETLEAFRDIRDELVQRQKGR